MLSNKLSTEEIQTLTKFRLTQKVHKASNPIRLERMLRRDGLVNVLALISEQMGAPSYKVAASMLSKRMAFYAVIHLYTMSAFNKRLLVDRENVLLTEQAPSNLWLPDFYLGNMKVEEERNDRRKWIDEIIWHVFKETLTPIVERLSEQVTLPKRVMWENIHQYVSWIFHKMRNSSSRETIKNQLDRDFHYILQTADGYLFGIDGGNPFARLYGRMDVKKIVETRKTCCLAYLLKDNPPNRCKTCPIPVNRTRNKKRKEAGT
ncbi:IucA/IucC family C-terminal-domain containing protein [Virgibacillus alimentarius]|uniref:IucA/IucC family C-terminal-domain containing protein n=1 Tax=Virgibacillus alimentarius TaxID=698769 RepID=UPI0004933781|nr:IucA/IucC family C-terminal-domain containing protein [Virgibacillus alimentarius]